MTDWHQWQMAMGDSELDASITSECILHFLIPEARGAFPGQEIWVDRYLTDRRFRRFVATEDMEEVGVLRGMLTFERLRALAAPTHNDYIEFQIANYGRQNMAWYVIWSHAVGCGPNAGTAAWRVVEDHMARPDWSERLQDWLEENRHPITGCVPFHHQATEFERIYKQSVKEFGNGPFYT